MHLRGVFCGFVAATVAAWALAASGPAAADETRTLRIVSPWEITGLDPARSGYIFARLQVAETLVGADNGGNPVPSLAENWTVSPDGLSWRFRLRPNAQFHDGTPANAEAVARSLQRAQSLTGGMLTNAPIAEIAAADGVVSIRTDRPFVALLAFLAHSSAIVLAPSAYSEAGAVTRIVGTGPYRATVVEPPLKVEIAKFEGWAGRPPAIARASYLAVTRGETRTAMAESGQADLVYVLPPEAVDRLRRNPRLAVAVAPIPRTRLLKLNAASPFFADQRVRAAISFALDREGIAASLLRSPESQATQLFPPSLSEWHVQSLPALTHDTARARALLADAGWKPGQSGIVEKDGRPFRVTLRTFSDRPEQPPMAAAIQAQLREIGIDMRVAIVNSGEIPAGHRDGTLEMALFARNFSLVPDPIGTLLQDYGPQGGDWGAMNWSSADLARTLEMLGSTSDPAERARLRAAAARVLHAELPVIPVAWFDYGVAASRRLQNVSIDPFELSYRLDAMRWAE
ncbi:MAG: ABC transporter substrate-binding protein [Telmatospirillum sp.]|nr:ABC transporter substrate-binding protein [Telmatospirillum sp.]